VWTKFPKVDFIPNEILPIRVKEINENWSAGAVDMEGKFYPGGVYEKTLYLGLENWDKKEYFLGNPIICDCDKIRIEIEQMTTSTIECILHNPTEKKVTITLKPAPAIVNRILPSFSVKFKLFPFQTKKVKIKLK